MCVCVCACNPLKEHVVANSALYVFTVNGRDAPKLKFWAENSGCAWSKTKNAFVIIIYFIKYYKVILKDF